ncbi:MULTISPECIES: metallophosphoesterase [Exiguobacterium]|uniref:metallophosphoesterase family protein n=1 Tax=Exiguobacterium sp. s161 TaxID=2751191 RepID=UPI001BEC7C2B|nr:MULTISPECIES: metallophosphoesterase family protein [Exiguobacterium]
MRYALFADLHSSLADTAAVLADIRRLAPDAHLFCLGDVHECHVGKKRAKRYSFESLSLVVTLDDDFLELIDFKTLLGNQEERILSLVPPHLSPVIDALRDCPRKQRIEGALLIHGDQLSWSRDFLPNLSQQREPLLFFGHSHIRGLFQNGIAKPSPLGQTLSIKGERHAVNLGPVVFEREWCLYDSEQQSIVFHQAK